MTRATYGYSSRPIHSNFFMNKFASYKIGANSIVIEPNLKTEKQTLKEIVAKETEDLLNNRQRLSVRELALKFEKGLNTATWLSDEVKWRQVALLERDVLLKKLRDALESLRVRAVGKNKDELDDSISMVETLTVQLTQREGELLQQKEEVKKLATTLKLASEDAKRIVEQERESARIEIESAKSAVQRVEQAFNECEKLSRRIDNQDIEDLKTEVQEARRIKMLHHPSKVMDMEFEIKILRNKLAEKSAESINLQKELETHRRPKDKCVYELKGLESLGSYLQIIPLNNTAKDISTYTIQWYRMRRKEGKRELISGATREIYAPEPYDVGRLLEAEIISGDEISRVSTAGPIDPAAGLVDYVEVLVRKPETEFNVVIIKINGNDQQSDSIHILNIGRLRIKLSKGKAIIAKEFYSSSMQLCGVRGGGDAPAQSLFWGAKKGLSFILGFESARERNAALMLARRFSVDCNIMLVGPGDPTPGWTQ